MGKEKEETRLHLARPLRIKSGFSHEGLQPALFQHLELIRGRPAFCVPYLRLPYVLALPHNLRHSCLHRRVHVYVNGDPSTSLHPFVPLEEYIS